MSADMYVKGDESKQNTNKMFCSSEGPRLDFFTTMFAEFVQRQIDGMW